MTYSDLLEALASIEARPDLAHFVGKRNEDFVRAGEDALGVRFPRTYREFVQRLGAGNFGASEIFGIVTGDIAKSQIPDAVGLTLRARRDWGLPDSMVVVYFDGGESYYVLESVPGDDHESPRFAWPIGDTRSDHALKVIADDFGAFLRQMTAMELGRV